jgi:DNA-binding IscR family transcriptional regulator
MAKAGFVKAVRTNGRGYVFARKPESISLLELFELVEGGPLFEDCLLRHCECGGTTKNCCIFAKWSSATKKINQLLSETSLVTAAWNHPEHRFYSLPKSLEVEKNKSKQKPSTSNAKAS